MQLSVAAIATVCDKDHCGRTTPKREGPDAWSALESGDGEGTRARQMASNMASSSSSTTGDIVRLSSADACQHAEALRELATAC